MLTNLYYLCFFFHFLSLSLCLSGYLFCVHARARARARACVCVCVCVCVQGGKKSVLLNDSENISFIKMFQTKVVGCKKIHLLILIDY